MDHLTQDAVAAAFDDRDVAHACYEALDRLGFPHRWMAVTKPARDEAADGGDVEIPENDVVEASDGVLGAIGRFFSGEGNSLRRSLEDHGIATDEAIAIDESLGVGGAVIVVAAHGRPEIAAALLRQGGGEIYGAVKHATGAYDVRTDSVMAMPASVDASENAAASAPAEEPGITRTLELREERLQVEKTPVPAGATTVGKRVVSEPASLDVPVTHEELFVRRRPTDGVRPATGEIGDDQTIVVPLERDRVEVEKVPVVREEVVVGKRRVEGIEHVETTLRREELEVDDPRGASRTV